MTVPTAMRVFRFTRAGAPPNDPVQFAQHASGVLARIPNGTTFVTRRTEQGLEHLLVIEPGPDAEGSAMHIAIALKAEMRELDETPDLSEAEEFARLTWTRRSMVGASNMVNSEVSTVAVLLGAQLRPGEWIAMSVREPSKSENRWNNIWVRARLGSMSHQSMSSHSKIMSLWAGGLPGRSTGALLTVAGALPGFGLRAEALRISPLRVMWRPFIAAGLTSIAAAFAVLIDAQLPLPWYVLPSFIASAVIFAGYGLGAAGKLPGVPMLPGAWRRLTTLFQWGMVPVAPRKHLKPKPPLEAKVMADSTVQQATEGDYPLQPEAFLVSAHYPCLIVNPHAGAFSGQSSTSQRPVPIPLRDENVGPEIGSNGDLPAFLSWSDMWSGTFIVGVAGSGKTALLEWLWGETCRAVSAGMQMTPVAFDTKGDGAASKQMQLWAAEHRVTATQYDVADTAAGIAIDLFPRVGPISQQARRIVDAFVYLYGEVSVGARSADVLERVFAAALTLTPESVTQAGVPGVKPHGSPFHFAYVLLGGIGDGAGKALADHIAMQAAAGDESATFAREQLAPLYSPETSPSRRREVVEAPRNKVSALITMEHWWAAPNKVSWGDLLSAHQPVVINTGQARTGEQPSDHRITQEMGSLLLYSLRHAVVEHCGDWQVNGRSVRVFADEVKAVAAASPEVVSWMRSDGRAYGVEAVFATQQPSQLTQEVRAAVMGFGTMIAFVQNEESAAKEIASNLALDGSEWSPHDIVGLQRFTAVVRATFLQERMPAFTITVPDFRARRSANEE